MMSRSPCSIVESLLVPTKDTHARAAGKYFDKRVFPNLGKYTAGWVIVHWDDTNMNGFVNNPGEGDTYTVIAVGN
jgi:hypothetical protein